MGETRDPARGNWTVFEGDTAITHKDHVGPTNADIVWPITFRVFRIRDRVATCFDVVIDETLTVIDTRRSEDDLQQMIDELSEQ